MCGESYRLHYLERLRPVTMSSALLFGSAMDEALNYMLEHKEEPDVLAKAIKEFNAKWEQGINVKREVVDIPLNPDVKYFKSDFDAGILEKKDWAELFKYDAKLFETKNAVDDMLKNGTAWVDIPEEMRMPYNYSNWLCMQKKGQLMLTAYHRDILPQIKEVLTVQMNISLTDEDGNEFTGVIDFVARLQDGRIMVMDNKTSGSDYEEDAVFHSEQLATYMAILNIFADDPEHSWNHKIEGAGYAVMLKKMIKEKTCEDCGHVSQGSHKTCDNLINGKRCNGAWGVKLDAKTQFLVGEISPHFSAEVLENAGTVKTCIEQGLFPKNYSTCSNIYGSPCPYINYCHKGDTKGLIKLEESKNENKSE